MSIELLLAENQFTIDRHFEHAASGRNDLPLRDLKFKFFQNFSRQTDGFVGVASLCAVFKCDMQLVHRVSLGGRSDDDHFIAGRIKRIEFVRSVNFLEIEAALLQQQLYLIAINKSE